MRVDERHQLAEQQLADRSQIALALQHAGERARLVLSQSCSVLRSVVNRRLSIMVLMLPWSSATSPRAATWIDRVRSPLVTAVATRRSRAPAGEVGSQQVHVAGQVLPRAGRAGTLA